MITLIRLFIALVVALFVSSCNMNINWGEGVKGNGIVEEAARPTADGFTEVSVSEGLNLVISQGATHDIKVEADENVIDLIRTDIKNGALRIHTDQNIGRATKNIYVTLPVIVQLNASSGSDLKSEGRLEVSQLGVDVSSGADVEISVVAERIEVEVSSGADITLIGETQFISASSSSGANINAKNFKAESATAHASSGSDITLQVQKHLTAEASSGADIKYLGDPEVSSTKSVSGGIRKL